MVLTRRQLLLLGGITLGLGGSMAARDLLRRSPSASARPRLAVAPAGLYAPPRGDVRLVVISDLNSRYGETTYIEQVRQTIPLLPDWQPDLVICAGDMVAGQSRQLSKAQIEAMWTAFDQTLFQQIHAMGLPYAFTLGNHDASSYRGKDGKFVFAKDRDAAKAYWLAHKDQVGLNFVDAEGFPFYYSFTHNDLFFLVWDASSATIPEAAMAWVDRSLASEVARQAKMRMVIGHLPLYAVAQRRDRPGEILHRADQLRSRLERHNVHTYISGHHHAYFPGQVGALEVLHAGALGSGPRSWLRSTRKAMHTLTVVDIDLVTQATALTTYDMTNRRVIDLTEVPRVLVGPNGRVIRKDLTVADLTPAELALKHVPS